MKTKHLILLFPLTVLVLFMVRTTAISNGEVAVEKQKPRITVTEIKSPSICPLMYLIEDSKTGRDHILVRWSDKIKVIKLDKPEPVQTITNISKTNIIRDHWWPTNIWIGPGIIVTNTNMNVGL